MPLEPMNTTSGDQPILIAGGGIAGLTAALLLAGKNRPVHVLEAREAFSEAGAGIQLGPNATHVLAHLGLLGEFKARAAQPDAIRAREGQTGQILSTLPLGADIEKRHGAPYLVAHRADLQAVLLHAARQQPLITITNGFRCIAAEQDGNAVTLRSERGEEATGPVAIAADGIWSQLRGQIVPNWSLGHSTHSAMRTVIARQDAPEELREHAVGNWLSPTGHVVHYPVRNGDEVAIVIISKRPAPAPGWGHEVSHAEVIAELERITPALDLAFVTSNEWRQWSLFDTPAPQSWVKGRLVLIGDAAHPVLPFMAQGGVLAIEDAAVLAHCLTRDPHEIERALRAYETSRRPRAIRIKNASRQNGQIFHMSGAMRMMRNLAMRSTPPAQLIARYDWVYSWKAPGFENADV